MVSITDKHDCCGCGACVQACPVKCISFDADSEGFRYPQVDTTKCINCGLCERVCPESNCAAVVRQPKTYAAYCIDPEVRGASSSGGIFTILATYVIDRGGVVFGARFADDCSVVHDYTEIHEGLSGFRGSKYLQSRVGNSFVKVRDFLKTGRMVLFSGTPCQVAALRLFLHEDYSNLLLVDFICHGVPSPAVWKLYLESLMRASCGEGGKNAGSMSLNACFFRDMSFRDKAFGWKRYGIRLKMSPLVGNQNTESSICAERVILQRFTENPYMKAFLSNLSLRPSCYICPAKGFISGSDITLGDFWGIDKVDPSIDDDRGVSVLFIHNDDVRKMLQESGVFLKEEPFDKAVRFNPSVLESVEEPAYRAYFFKHLNRSGGFRKAYKAVFSQSLTKRITRRLWLQFANK